MCLPIILLKQLSAGLKQGLILHLGASVPYLLPNVTSFHYHKVGISVGSILCFTIMFLKIIQIKGKKDW